MLTIATCAPYPALPQNFEPRRTALHALGVQTEVQPWQAITQADCVLPICAWDYAQFPQQFAEWLTTPIRFVNPPNLMRWNMHKSYLCDLAHQGVNVIPSEVIVANAEQIYLNYPLLCPLFAYIMGSGNQSSHHRSRNNARPTSTCTTES